MKVGANNAKQRHDDMEEHEDLIVEGADSPDGQQTQTGKHGDGLWERDFGSVLVQAIRCVLSTPTATPQFQ